MPSRNRGNNNNPSGRNQYSNGWMDTAKERPLASAVTAAAAVGAGVFLWSRRNQISEQLSNLTDQISEWSDNMRQGSQSDQFEMADGGSMSSSSGSSSMSSRTSGGSAMNSTGSSSGRSSSSGRKSGSRSAGMSETGGGNASLGAHSGGSGIGGSSS